MKPSRGHEPFSISELFMHVRKLMTRASGTDICQHVAAVSLDWPVSETQTLYDGCSSRFRPTFFNTIFSLSPLIWGCGGILHINHHPFLVGSLSVDRWWVKVLCSRYQVLFRTPIICKLNCRKITAPMPCSVRTYSCSASRNIKQIYSKHQEALP